MPSEAQNTKHNRNRYCPDASAWQSRDEQSAEQEVSDFAYSLIRLIKPEFVIETGCYLGDSTYAMASAIKDNGFGDLISCDINQERVDIVNKRLKDNNLPGEVYCMKGADMIRQHGLAADFGFVDSGNEDSRDEEVDLMIMNLAPGKMFMMHDTGPQFTGFSEIADIVDLPKVYFNTPRGLTLFMKPFVN